MRPLYLRLCLPEIRPVHSRCVRRRAACFALGLLSLLTIARAGDGGDPGDAAALSQQPVASAADKSQYNLFNPTPDNLLREFESSRPDQTTGPHTVDAGHFYLEVGLFENSLNDGASRTSSWIPLQNSHFRLGLTNTIELELIYDGVYNENTQALPATGGKRTDKTVDVASGNFTVRMRFNLIGDDGGPFAFAIIPQFTAPTATSHIEPEHFEGSVILPVSFKLPAGFSTILQVEPGSSRNADDTKDAFALVSGATLYHDLFRKRDRVQLYLEYFDTLVTGRDGTLAQQVDVGVRWRPIENWQLDFGSNFGVSKDAPDYQSFAGLSTRF
jgi:hypothetical protein